MNSLSLIIIFALVLLIGTNYGNLYAIYAEEVQTEEYCPKGDIRATKPSIVDIEKIYPLVSSLKTVDGIILFNLSLAEKGAIADIFNPEITKTKITQFYTLLYRLATFVKIFNQNQNKINVDNSGISELIIESGVLYDDSVPKELKSLSIEKRVNSFHFEIVFNKSGLFIHVNKGMGFRIFKDGKCQRFDKLRFGRKFTFDITLNDSGNILAYNFKNVDLVGDFGKRGAISIDVNYVSLLSVEFIKRTIMGTVKARVSELEFELNNHNFLFEMVAKVITDTTTQILDW